MPPHSQQLLTQIVFGDHMGDHMGTLKVSRQNRVCKVLLCFIDPRVRKIRIEASSCPGIFSRTLHFYYVASSPGSPLSHRSPKSIALRLDHFESRSPLRMRIWILIIGTGVDKCLLVRRIRQRPFKRWRISSSSNFSTVWYAPSLIMYVWFHVRVAAKNAWTRQEEREKREKEDTMLWLILLYHTSLWLVSLNHTWTTDRTRYPTNVYRRGFGTFLSISGVRDREKQLSTATGTCWLHTRLSLHRFSQIIIMTWRN